MYIELNSVRARLITNPENWRWSSYHFYAFGEKDPLIRELIDPDPYYLEIGQDQYSRQKKYRDNMTEVMEEKFLENIRRNLDKGIFSSTNFLQISKEKFKIGFPKSSGRPRKEKEKNQS